MSEEPSLPEVASDTVEIIILKSPLEVMSFIDELRRQHGIGNLNDGLTVLGFDLYSEALQEFGFIFRSRNLVNAEGNPSAKSRFGCVSSPNAMLFWCGFSPKYRHDNAGNLRVGAHSSLS